MFRDKDVYLIGIGGCGMSGLARMVASGRPANEDLAGARSGVMGTGVMGSDSMVTAVTAGLTAEGIIVEKDDESLPESVGVVIASAAIHPDHPQLLAAQERGLEVLTYAEALGQCMGSRTGVALAGTHGKSTTTAMLGTALVDAGLDPSVIVGAVCGQLANGTIGGVEGNKGASGGNGATGFRLGAGEIPRGSMSDRAGLLLCEACEFNRSFHHLRPMVASISAVEADHLDIYGSLDAVVEAFAQFAQLVPDEAAGGKLLIAHEGAHRREITAGVTCSVETIGFSPSADWSVIYEPTERRVTLSHHREVVAHWQMLLPGEHNAMNAATACALAIMLGAEARVVAESLGEFRGVTRRTEFLGRRPLAGSGDVRVWDDYGHHPTEIDKTLRALREFERPEERDGRLICVFQPHQHSRTRFFLDEFATSFENADIVIVPHIYFVRDSEAEKHKVSSADLVDRLRSRGVRAMHVYPFDAIVEQLESVCRDGDVVVSMGAGPVCDVARGFMKAAPSAVGEAAHAAHIG